MAGENMSYNARNGYNTYREIGVKTASRGSLVVMLYDGAVSHLKDAISLINDSGKIEPNNMEKYGRHIQKVTDIISELQATLNMEEGGEIAQNLMSLYIFFNKQLLDNAIRHDKTNLSKILSMLSDLRDSWSVAANSTANTEVSVSSAIPSISITG